MPNPSTATATVNECENFSEDDILDLTNSTGKNSRHHFEITKEYAFKYPLHVRAIKGDHSVLETEDLFEKCHFDDRQMNPLHILGSQGVYHVISYPKIEEVRDADGFTPLHHFAYQDKNLDILLNYKEITQHKTFSGVTPLHILAKRGIVKIISHPAISKIRDKNYNTLLHILADRANVDFDKIVSHPESASVLDGNDNTVLHVLALRGKAASFIVQHPKSHTVKNSIGSTPLHILGKRGMNVIEKHPAASKVYDNYEMTPLDYLRKRQG